MAHGTNHAIHTNRQSGHLLRMDLQGKTGAAAAKLEIVRYETAWDNSVAVNRRAPVHPAITAPTVTAGKPPERKARSAARSISTSRRPMPFRGTDQHVRRNPKTLMETANHGDRQSALSVEDLGYARP
jgi:hypothetical protein